MRNAEAEADVRGELARLDRELSQATAALRQQRDAFARQVASQDVGRRERGHKVVAALADLEQQRAHMEELHRELESERQVAQELEKECEDLECLERRDAVRHQHEEEERKELQRMLRTGLEELFDQAIRSAESTAAISKSRIEASAKRVTAAEAATRAATAALVRSRAERATACAEEKDCLLSSMSNAEEAAIQLLNVMKQGRTSPRVEVAALHSEVTAELHAGLVTALAKTGA